MPAVGSAAYRFVGLRVRVSPSVVCCQVEVSASGRSLVQSSPSDCGVSLCVMYKAHK
jgi:hypothetical protein